MRCRVVFRGEPGEKNVNLEMVIWVRRFVKQTDLISKRVHSNEQLKILCVEPMTLSLPILIRSLVCLGL